MTAAIKVPVANPKTEAAIQAHLDFLAKTLPTFAASRGKIEYKRP